MPQDPVQPSASAEAPEAHAASSTTETAEEIPKVPAIPKSAAMPLKDEKTDIHKSTESSRPDDAQPFHADEKIDDFDWEDLLDRYEKEMEQKVEDERKSLEDFQGLVNVNKFFE